MLFIWLVLLQLTLFAVLVLFLRVILKRNIVNATSHLHALNQDYTQKLDEAKEKERKADQYYDETLLKAKLDAEKSRVQILKEAHEAQEKVVAAARKQSEEILAQANRSRETILGEIEQRIETRAAELAGELVAEVLPREVGEEIHVKWVDELLKNGLSELGRLRLPADLARAEVAAAYPLRAEQKRSLQKILKERTGRDLEILETAEPPLLAGLRVKLGSVVIDGSLQSRIREAGRHAQRAV
jgi:F0F1-type ATP synthase membrane subunit b/b'